MKKLSLATVLSSALIGFTAFSNADNMQTLPLDSIDNTEAVNVLAEVVNYQGRDAIKVAVDPDHKSIEEGGCDNCTYLLVDNAPFSNGVIEIDLAGKPADGAPAWARGFVGVVFRVNEDKSNYEGFYLRPMNALEAEPRRNFTSQYFSIPDYPWHVLREKFPNKYEKYADIKPGEWFTLKVEVDGAAAKFSINDEEIMTVNEMFQDADLAGGIGLFTEPETDAYFSNLRITHN